MGRATQQFNSFSLPTWLAIVGLVMLVQLPMSGLEWKSLDGAAHGYPVLRDLSGRRLADAEFSQWVAGDRLHVRIAYVYGDGRRAEETALFRQRPQLVQEAWSFRELQGKKPLRAFTVDFKTGAASAIKDEKGETKHWDEKLEIADGETFAGFGFSLAIRAIRERLVKGESVTLKGIGFAPKPRVASVKLSYAGRERIGMAGRTIATDHFVAHPEVPAIAKLFVKVPDVQIWLTTPPAGFLRSEGPMAEPDDPLVRVDLLPGGTSEAAKPVPTSGVRRVGGL